jgi:glycosyltransferase involved in cell wall biosynthesis
MSYREQMAGGMPMPHAPMRILHVMSSLAPRYGGPPQVCLELCQELARRGERVSIYSTNMDGPGELDVPLTRSVWTNGVEVRYFPVQAPRSYAMSWPFARALRRAIPEQDIVHIHSLYVFPSTVAAYYCRRSAVPYLVRPHGSLDPYLFRRHRGRKWVYERLIEWRNLNRAAAIHYTAQEEEALVRPLGLRARGVIVPPGVHADRYAEGPSRAAFDEAWPETRGRRVILYLGRLNFKKGLDLLARAFGQLVRQREDVHLLLAGPDNEGYGATVRRWLEAEGVLQRCTFAGMLVGSRKLAALRNADVFALPSYTENFGVAVVEAMACGLPVVISNRVNIWREVAEAGAGIVVDCDAEEVRRALAALLDDPAGRQGMGKRARRLVRERFSWEAAGDRMVEAYRQILTEHRQRMTTNRLQGEASACA